MRTSGEIKKLLPGFVTCALALGTVACGDQKSHDQTTRHRSAPTTGIHLPPNPPNVLTDTYVDGKRIVTFKPGGSLLSLVVIEVCDSDGAFIETTERIVREEPHKYDTETSADVHGNSKSCVGDRVAYDTLSKIPEPQPYPMHQHKQAPQSQEASQTV